MTVASGEAMIARLRGAKLVDRAVSDLPGAIALYCTYALFVLLPIVMTPFTDEQYTLPKVTVLRLLTIAILLSLTARSLRRGRMRWRRLPMDIPALAFAAIAVLATLFSVNPALSLRGEFQRHDGLYTVLNYVALYFVASRLLNTGDRVRGALRCFAAGSIAVASLGLFAFLRGGEGGPFGARIFATYGNPDFLGSYLVMTVPVAGALAMSARERFERGLWLLAVALGTIALTLTYTRAAWIGFVGALAVFMFGGRRQVGQVAWPVLMVVAVALGIATVGSTSVPYPSGAVVSPTGGSSESRSGADATAERSVIGRLAATTDLASGTAAIRLAIWSDALPLIAARPLLGSGLSTFALVFPRLASPEYARSEGRDHVTDQAHNGYLQLAVTTGLVGLAVYLWLLTSFGAAVWRQLRRVKGNARWLGIGLLAAWLGYLVQDFFLFGTVGTAGLWWLLCGVAMAVVGKDVGRPWRHQSLKPLLVARRPLLVAMAVLAVYASSLAVKPVVADYYAAQARALLADHFNRPSSQRFEEAFRLQREAMAWNPDEAGYVLRYAVTIAGLHDGQLADQALLPALRDGIERLDRAIALDPLRPWLYLNRGVLRWRLGGAELSKAFDDMQQVTLLYPNFYYGNRGVAEVGHDLGRFPEAIEAERRLLTIDPSDQWASFNLAADLSISGRHQEGIQVIESALKSGDDASLRVLQGLIYEKMGQPEMAGTAYRAALAADPQSKEAQQRLESLSTDGDRRNDGK